ncbi:MAG: carboxypeptidase-like regulatory domain-containing protein, partial [Calditrichaeota bacterium]|nr:carboxypeptidase-like regulatory domain-containing protein [Calditrichota bacterium]
MKQHNLHFYRFIVPVMLLVLAQGLWAQGNGRISGKVVDEKTQEPLIGVNIEVLGSNTGTTTDSEGSFWLEQLIPGTYRLRFSYIGYQDLVLTDIIVNSARPAIVNARLLIVPVEGEAVTVTSGYFSDASDKPVSNITFSREEIRRFPGGFEDV